MEALNSELSDMGRGLHGSTSVHHGPEAALNHF